MKSDLQTRIASNAYASPQSGCWIWQLGMGRDGYGKIKINKKTVRAHRASWLAFRGEIPESMLICHKCDNPMCVNPDHLFLGTPMDNMRDKVEKGRWRGGPACWEKDRKGAGHHNAKLNDAKVRLIRLLGKAISTNRWAAEFGVSHQAIKMVQQNKTWTHVQ